MLYHEYNLSREVRRPKILIASVCFTLFLIVFLNSGLINFGIYYEDDVFILRRHVDVSHVKVPHVVSCHYVREGNALPSLDQRFYPSSNSIFFHETSCNGRLNSRQACSVESAARAHPNWQIHVLFSAPVSKLSLGDVNIELLKMLKNVYFSRVHILDYSKGTPLEKLISGGALNKSKWPIAHTSDILRFLTLYKWGGIYLDLDIMVVKPLDGLEKSWAAREHHALIGSAALSFYRDRIGMLVADSAVRELAESFRGNEWGHNGPKLITRVLKKFCSTKDVSQMNALKCLGFEVYDSESFYPIKWENASYYFGRGVLNNSEAYTYHVWNKISYNKPVRNDSRYANLAKKYCPTVYEAHPEDFGNMPL